MSSIPIEINGKPFKAEPHSTIIEVADQAGIYIPRFCYHKKLSVAANCRMCLVEVEKSAKPLPACATPVSPGMKIATRSPKTKAAQQAVMEFLLINHPLDCPICDQGGQCELQDLAMRYGRDHSEFTEHKRAIPNDNLGSLVATEMTRCIHCTRCVRFGTEIAGIKELGATGRGENMQITTYISHSLRSELSGNIIDLCPVGALTSKPFQFKARAWELQQTASIAPHDCLGSHIAIHSAQQRVMRVVPREYEAINETWLSDRDRYSYLGLESEKRLRHPMVKVGARWQVTDWSTALDQAARELQSVLKRYGPQQLGALISPSATLEEMYLLQYLCRALGSPHIDHRLQQKDVRDQAHFPLYPKADITIAELAHCDLIVLVGANIQRTQPLLATRLRKAIEKGGAVAYINCLNSNFNFEVAFKVITSPSQWVNKLESLVKAINNQDSTALPDDLCALALQLKTAKKIAILVGATAYNHPQAANLRHWVTQLAHATGASELHLTEGANSSGAWITGAIPHRMLGGRALSPKEVGLSAYEMLEKPLKAYLLVNLMPSLDCFNASQAQAAMQSAECVIALSAFQSDDLLASAKVLLPLAPFAETGGTFINIEGNWQSFQAAISPLKEAKPGWEILQVLGNALGLSTLKYPSVEAVRDDLKALIVNSKPDIPSNLAQLEEDRVAMAEFPLTRITEWSLYSADPLVRHAGALQEAASNEQTGAYIHPDLAKRLSLDAAQSVRLQQGAALSASLPIIIDARIPDYCVWTPGGRKETATLGAAFGELQIIKGVESHE